MTNADKMFEELGYKETTTMVYKTRYYKDNENVIKFSEDKKVYKTREYDGFYDGITIPELKAINEKCKELGWLDNDEQHIPRID